MRKIVIFGFAFKAGTSDTRSTSAALFCASLALNGFEVHVTDPKVPENGFEWEMAVQGFESQTSKIKFHGADYLKAVK